jgi:O-antigen ligase
MLIGIGVISVSLRRGIMLAVFLSPLFIAALAAALPRQQRVEAFRSLGVLVGVLCMLLVVAALFAHFRYHWTPDNMLAFFRQGYEFGTSREPGAVARSQQAGALIDAWSRNPIFGAGAGAGGASYVRDPAQPWAYELSYLALLYQTGLAGLLLYAGGMVWIFWNGIQMIRSGHPLALRLLPVLIGVAAFLVGNATNPYLAKFDYAWVIFLPVAYINLWLLNPDRESARPEHGGPVGERIPGSH